MTRRINGDALENRDGTAATGDVFVFDDAHVDGGEWEAPAASAAWPVGSIFFAAVSTNPATLLGFGTWLAIGAGRVLIGIDAGDADFDTLGETGGAKTSAHAHGAGTLATSGGSWHSHGAGTLVPSAHSGGAVDAHSGTAVDAHSGTAVGNHTVTQPDAHSSHVHAINSGLNATISAHGSHTHGAKTAGLSAGSNPYYDTATDPGNHTLGGSTETSASMTHSGTAVSAHSVTQPSNHVVTQPSAHVFTQPSAHTMSGTTADEGSHTHSVGSGSTGSDSPSVVQPYLVVAMWQRTA